MSGLDMGSGMGAIPPETVYWHFGRQRGAQWDSPVGRQRISARGDRVNTPSGNYDNTIEVETIDRENKSMFWTFAPGVGLVRWGRGGDAYLLTSVRTGSDSSAGRGQPREAARPAPSRPSAARTPSSSGDARLLIGLDANPWSGVNEKQALQEAFDAGMTIVHLVPTWNDLERSPGKYEFKSIDTRSE